jgi:uncharacterized protein YggE
LSLQPRYVHSQQADGEKPRLVAYLASNQVVVRLRDIGKLGQLLDTAVAAGANDIQGVTFDIADRTSILNDVRHRAVEDAKLRATAYAKAAGITLGEVVSLSEEYDSPTSRSTAMRTVGIAAAAVPIEAGELRVRARVRIVWRIAN